MKLYKIQCIYSDCDNVFACRVKHLYEYCAKCKYTVCSNTTHYEWGICPACKDRRKPQ